MKFYFTYGSDGHPFVGGWTEVEASDVHTACHLFRAVHPDKISGIMNCSCCYSQEQFNATRMGETGNFDQFCHERITHHLRLNSRPKGVFTMIRDPKKIQEGEKKIRMLIAGYPGIGKSTLALSAPNPLHIDVDFGIDRIEPRYRVPYIQPKDYQEILDDLTPMNTQGFDTLVFDTGGKLISLMSLWAIKKDPKYGQRDGSLSLKGYGFVGKEFVRLMDYCFYELQKNIVVVFHAVEEKDGDNTRLRIKVEGQTKNNVWEPMDLGGFVEVFGNDRTIGFSNCERYFAKGTRGIHGIWKIPALGSNSQNDFLTKLFADYNSKAAAEVAQNAADQAAYETAMETGRSIIAAVSNADAANEAMPYFKEIPHALTSEKELTVAWNKRIKELGLFYDKVLGKYTPVPKEPKGAE